MSSAGHHSMMSGGAKWNNPYITNGLIAMWDGEWNAGGGRHDSTARVIDCVGGREMNFVQGPKAATFSATVAAQSIALAGATSELAATDDAVIRAAISQSPLTIEWMVSFDLTAGARPYLAFTTWQNGPWDLYLGEGVGGNARIGFNQSKLKFSNTLSQTVAFVITGSSIEAYSNGSLVATKTPSAASTSDMNEIAQPTYTLVGSKYPYSDFAYYGDFGFLRIYSRALTAAEIAANYAIDATRFSLPTS